MRAITRFGERAVAEELGPCVEELMSGTGHCKPGEEHDYRSCFRGCIASLSVSEGDYQPGDVPSNCTAGCAQTTCGHEPE